MIIRNPKSFHRKRATTEIVTGHFLLNGTSKQVDSEAVNSYTVQANVRQIER